MEPDGEHARRDVRLFFRESWILIVGLVVFGGVGVALVGLHQRRETFGGGVVDAARQQFVLDPAPPPSIAIKM